MSDPIACEFCDLLHTAPALRPGGKAYCARCGGVLARAPRNPVERSLALALTAGVLLILANVFPFLQISLEGQVSENTIASGVVGLWKGGQHLLAGLILHTTILAPALRIVGLCYVLAPLAVGRVPPVVAGALRFQEGLVSWSMLDVYMLALLVTLVKLSQLGSLQLETGAYCFVTLFVVLVLLGASYDRAALWERVDELQ